MVDGFKIERDFSQLTLEDRDLTMLTMTNLTLNEKEVGNMVFMTLKVKRKVALELLSTYLPTILLPLITFTTVFFGTSSHFCINLFIPSVIFGTSPHFSYYFD